MNLIDFIRDQQSNLRSQKYVDMLWCKITDSPKGVCVTLEDEEIYQNHIPVEFTKFLKKCVRKLRDIKFEDKSVEWNRLDSKYFMALLYYAIQHEDVTMDNALYAANIFFLVNAICPSGKHFFYKVLYLKIMEVLKEFNTSQDMSGTEIIMYLMDDLKTFLTKCAISEDLIIPTVSVLQDYTYCCNDVFENIDLDISFENLGYIAFVSLEALVEQLSQQKNSNKKLFPILLALTSNLKSATNVSRTVRLAHQKNVRLFIKQNFNKFSTKSFCLVTDMLKFVYLHSEYDDFDGIAQIIQQLPGETHRSFLTFFQNSLLCDNVEFRKNSLNMVLPILHHPAEHETNEKRSARSEILINSVVRLCGDKDRDIQQSALRILSVYSDNNTGCTILKKILSKDNQIMNRDLIMSFIHKIVDKRWHKKEMNVNYIHLMCNLLAMQDDLISIRTLNKLRDICLAGSPFDLKPCAVYLKQLLKCHADKPSVIIYILSIFVKQLFHPMQTSAFFAKELHEFIFSHITFKDENDFIWNIVNYLISNNFDVLGVFERFHNLELLREQSVRILLKYKIQQEQTRTPALKLLCVMMHFVKYKDCHRLEEKLEQVLGTNKMVMSDTDTYLIVYALNKQLDKKKPSDCSSFDINNYRRFYGKIKNSFLDQTLPITCVKYAILLLSSYTRLIQEELSWDRAACSLFEENLGVKLTLVLAKKLKYSSYISRDIVYVAELSILKAVSITDDNFNRLKVIAAANDHTLEFTNYLKNHQEIWSLCIYLYIKACFTNEDLIPECVRNLEATMNVADDNLKLQIIYGLLDMCNIHLQYYDPLLPHLFEALYSKNAYIRFIASKILMQLIGDEQLRLIDGQYFLFMGLLADEKEIISKNVEVFVREKYVAKYYQTIARYFVPSIIHYNFYYEHPAITLSQPDQDLLKKRIYSWNDRSFIYYCLYESLSDALKFNILNQISSEIILRILNETIPHSAEVFRILEDALAVILYTVPKNKIDNIEDDRKFYEAELKRIDNDLLVADLKGNETNIPMEHRVILENLLTSLIKLLYSDISKNPNICQNLLFTIIVFTKTFYSSVKRTIHEDTAGLRDLYKKLSGFYVNMKHNFVYCLLTVNPCNLETLTEKEDLEFYLHEFKNFHLISPSLILGVEE